MFEQSGDPKVKDMARRRLMQLTSFDERDVLQKVLSAYQSRAGRCPASWKELETALRSIRAPLDSNGAPLDPSGAPYVLNSATCTIALDPKSEIPAR
jgi:hypothetical protein